MMSGVRVGLLVCLLSWQLFVCCVGTDTTHIVGSSLIPLDGSSWQASSALVSGSACTFTQYQDYDNYGQDPGSSSSSSMQDCCQKCNQTNGCASAVWDGSVCYYKTLSAKPFNTTKNVWSCSLPVKRFSIPATVPGDIITDLQRAGLIPDPYLDINFLTYSSLWGRFDWTLTTTFTLSTPPSSSQEYLLVFEGIKMGARVFVDDTLLGTMDDQFLRYTYALSSVLSKSSNQHTVRLDFSSAIPCHNRFVACTGGWDWAPYTNVFQENVPTFSRGIWRSVYIVGTTTAQPAIEHVKPLLTYLGPYPNTPLEEHNHGGFNVTITTYLLSTFAIEGTLLVASDWGEVGCVDLSFPSPAGQNATEFNATIVLSAPASAIKLWWPNGLGQQPLYNIYLSVAPPPVAASDNDHTESTGGSPLQPSLTSSNIRSMSCQQRHRLATSQGLPVVAASRRIGFRTFVIVTGNDTDSEYVQRAASEEGTDSLGMFFRVNGAAMYAKGANMIPMEELEGRMNDLNHQILVQSVAAAHMNTLRVWGGGMYLPDAWYDACDEYGIVVFHDMQYATGGPHDHGGGPQSVPTQVKEMIHQLRRLSHHTSITVWDGCNECGGQGIYETFVMPVVAAEDTSRVIWPSSPSNGWYTGVHKLTQMPNGNTLSAITYNRAFDKHGPYFHGGGFPAVNGGIHGPSVGWQPVPFDPMMPAQFPSSPPPIGPQHPSFFTSEFGCSAFSSFESMSGTLSPSAWGVHGGQDPDNCTLGFAGTCVGENALSQRNYPCDNLIMTFFNYTDFNATGEAPFKQQMYLCLLGQALIMKQQIEINRANNSFGALIWQLGEIWPTGGWGSLEYGPSYGSPGQVPGGRWKILHHVLASATFTDVTVACGAGGVCYVRNDYPTVFSGAMSLSAIDVKTGHKSPLYSSQLKLQAGAGVVEWFNLPSLPPASTTLIEAVVTDSTGNIATHNIIHMLPPKDISFVQTEVIAKVANTVNADGSVDVTIETSPAPAFYTTLTTLAAGRFSDNAIVVFPGTPSVVKFMPFGNLDLDLLKTSLRVEHVAMYS